MVKEPCAETNQAPFASGPACPAPFQLETASGKLAHSAAKLRRTVRKLEIRRSSLVEAVSSLV